MFSSIDHRPGTRWAAVRRVCLAAAVAALLAAFVAPATARAQAMTEELVRVIDVTIADGVSTVDTANNRQVTEFEPATWQLTTTASGAPAALQAEVVASADIERLVVDVYVDGSLVDSVTDPAVIFVNLMDLAPEVTAATTVSLIGRDIAHAECDRFDGAISFRNVQLLRQPHTPEELAEAISVSVTGEDPINVANIAAAVERETILSGATVALDAGVNVSVVPTDDDRIVLAEVSGLGDQTSFATSTVGLPVNAERRAIQRTDIDLSRTGGTTFVSATGFGGRVNDVTVDGEIHLTPLASGGGFAVEVNERVIVSGLVDEDGFGAFSVDIADWPRDADISVRLALHEGRSACSPAIEGFAGTASLTLTPMPTSFDASAVQDFPQQFLEHDSIALWVDEDVPADWVAVAVAAIQDTSVEPLRFHAAPDADSASLRLASGAAPSEVVGASLTLFLDETSVSDLSTDRFWNVGTDVELVDASIVSEENTVAITEPGLEAPQAGWILTVVVAALAVAILLLFKKNSHQAP